MSGLARGVFALLVASGAAHAQAAQEDCTPPHRIDWPVDRPVWSLCWISPDSSSGIDGSGLELRDVSYKGQRVLRRAGLDLKLEPLEKWEFYKAVETPDHVLTIQTADQALILDPESEPARRVLALCPDPAAGGGLDIR